MAVNQFLFIQDPANAKFRSNMQYGLMKVNTKPVLTESKVDVSFSPRNDKHVFAGLRLVLVAVFVVFARTYTTNAFAWRSYNFILSIFTTQ